METGGPRKQDSELPFAPTKYDEDGKLEEPEPVVRHHVLWEKKLQVADSGMLAVPLSRGTSAQGPVFFCLPICTAVLSGLSS